MNNTHIDEISLGEGHSGELHLCLCLYLVTVWWHDVIQKAYIAVFGLINSDVTV